MFSWADLALVPVPHGTEMCEGVPGATLGHAIIDKQGVIVIQSLSGMAATVRPTHARIKAGHLDPA